MKLRTPTTTIIASFIVLISLGTFLLKLPASTTNGISLIDALFTATSAVSVTGLIVLDTAKDFTLFGQLIILTLIQLGGLGIMTFSIGIITLISHSLSIQWQFTFMGIYGDNRKLPIKRILRRIIIYTASFEAFIALLLFPFFCMHFPPGKALYYSIFHAISAFCNAGFSTFSDSLVSYSTNYYFNLVICLAIITGGIGFLVLNELIHVIKRPGKFSFRLISLQSKVVLSASLFLIMCGTVFFFFAEYNNILSQEDLAGKFIISLFHSISCRTAGFNSVDLAKLQDNTLFTMIILMVIGGSPGSIAGGIKTTTAWVICAIIVSKIRKQPQVKFFNRAISRDTVERSTTLLILSILVICSTTLVITSFGNFKGEVPFLHKLFEISSAYGTVGLSTGITSSLSGGGRIIVAVVMLLGRLGPLTFLAALSQGYRKIKIRYPEEHLMIG